MDPGNGKPRSGRLIGGPTISTERRHICFPLPIAEHYGPAGGAITTVTRRLAAELTHSGHRITVLTPDGGDDTYAEGEVHKLRFGPAKPMALPVRKAFAFYSRAHRWASRDYAPYLRSVMSELRKLRAPVVVCANDPVLARIVATRMPQIIVVLWLHNLMERADGAAMRSLPGEVRIIAVSQYVADWTSAEFGLPGDRITVVYSGVDSDLFCPRQDFLEPRSPLRVVSHGRIDPNKGYDIALRAVGRLRNEGLPVEMTLIGGVQTFGWPEDDLARYLAALNDAVADAQADWVGRVSHEEVAHRLREHDVACVLSRSEDPYTLASIEAMASGCAVVGARSGGIPEAIGSAGIVVDKESVDQVAGVLRGLIGDRTALADAKAAARNRALELTWTSTAEDLMTVIGGRP